eukprot:scaffold8551_cov132-Isochrysis_galbana.AAC.4
MSFRHSHSHVWSYATGVQSRRCVLLGSQKSAKASCRRSCEYPAMRLKPRSPAKKTMPLRSAGGGSRSARCQNEGIFQGGKTKSFRRSKHALGLRGSRPKYRRIVAVVAEQDGAAELLGAEAGALIVQHQPHVIAPAGCVPMWVLTPNVLQRTQQQQRALLRPVARLAEPAALARRSSVAPIVGLVGELDNRMHEERRQVDRDVEEVGFRRVGRAERRVEKPLMQRQLHGVQ